VQKKDELTQKADYEVWHSQTDPEKLRQMIERTNNMDCVGNVNEEVKLTARKALAYYGTSRLKSWYGA
jgi:hypothetical protein